MRKQTRSVAIGDVSIGSEHPILVQSMTNTKTENIEATIAQIKELEVAGCDIVRIAVPTMEAAKAIKHIKESISIPLVADIHFDYRLALEALHQGIDKLRLNPGNLENEDQIKEVVDLAKLKQVPIRIGVNSGSLAKHHLDAQGHVTAKGLIDSAMEHIRLLEKFNFYDIIISLKSSNVMMMIDAYQGISELCDYPLHIGVTEAGTPKEGIIKSSVGLGALLAQGIGDTLRVSLTGDPVEEVRVGISVLKHLGYREQGLEIISCPTCGRTNIDLIGLANKVEAAIEGLDGKLKIAVMGCIVNGPGEAKEADIGIAGGKGKVAVFKHGRVIATIPEEDALDYLVNAITTMLKEEKGD